MWSFQIVAKVVNGIIQISAEIIRAEIFKGSKCDSRIRLSKKIIISTNAKIDEADGDDHKGGGGVISDDDIVPEKKENELLVKPNFKEEDKDVECNNSETDNRLRLSSCEKYKEGEHIAATRTACCLVNYCHHGVVVGFETKGGQVLPMVVHWQCSAISKSCDDYKCECGYKGPPKKGGYVKSCLKCFARGRLVFKIKHIGKNLLPRTHTKWKADNFTPGKVLYAGYCNNKFYLGYYSAAGIFQGYRRVKKKDHKQKPVHKEIKFIETGKRLTSEVLKAAEDEKLNSKPYSLVTNNCEHAAMLIMTGMRRSFQLENCPDQTVRKIWKLLCCHRCCFRPEDVAVNTVEME